MQYPKDHKIYPHTIDKECIKARYAPPVTLVFTFLRFAAQQIASINDYESHLTLSNDCSLKGKISSGGIWDFKKLATPHQMDLYPVLCIITKGLFPTMTSLMQGDVRPGQQAIQQHPGALITLFSV